MLLACYDYFCTVEKITEKCYLFGFYKDFTPEKKSGGRGGKKAAGRGKKKVNHFLSDLEKHFSVTVYVMVSFVFI